MAVNRGLHCISMPADGDLSGTPFGLIRAQTDGDAMLATAASSPIV